MTGSQAKAAADLLEWYAAMGADEAILEAPVDRFAAPEPSAEPQAEYRAPRAPRIELRADAPAPRVKSRAAPVDSRPAPASLEAAKTLAELEALVGQFEGCALKRTAKNTCFARGSTSAKIMLSGEAPGRDEDLQGTPFVGRAGKLLDRMLAAIGLDETQVYITNTIYWRPPGNRTPTALEMQACAPFLSRQIELLSPEVLLVLGAPAAKAILGEPGIMRARGKWKIYRCGDRDIPTLATLHPAYLLRKPEEKRYAWRDLLMLKERLESLT
ncbi:MAG: uracil-DNA glycosylase [Methyloceanibacter sp.]|uniref:uracil-DNA glycosylase n=1 Tax=Methyloceanibacter sp. TaxID=1965321 RepID=UPI003EE073D1